MLISKPHLCTKIAIFYPKYDTDGDGWEVWPLVSKVHYASPIIIIEFTRAKHLQGQRFAVRRQDVERSPIGTNGKSKVYRVPFSKLEPWETPSEIREIALNIWKDKF